MKKLPELGTSKMTSWWHALTIALLLASCGTDAADSGVADVIASDTADVTASDTVDAEVSPPSDVAETSEDTGEVVEASGFPTSLPFTFERPSAGEPVSSEEVTAFSQRLAALLDKADYFRWVLRTSHGVDASTGLEDYMAWWHNVVAVKDGDVVTFTHTTSGGGHNIYIPTPNVFNQAVARYLATGDEVAGEVVSQYAKGFAAMSRGMVYDADDPEPYLMPRNVVTFNHSFEIDGGRQKAVDYSAWYSPYEVWNTHRFKYDDNPFWGEVWVTNMRSKDDVPHIFRAVPYLRQVVEQGEHEAVREAAALGLTYLEGFAKDIVDTSYQIRTKDKDGVAYVPEEDLASFTDFDFLIPLGECDAKVSSALIAYGEALGNDCEDGFEDEYELVAISGHYYNQAIIRGFHVSAVHNALAVGQGDVALPLLEGLAARMDRDMDPGPDQPGIDHASWDADLAVFLVRCAATGLPLTAAEVRHIHLHFDAAVAAYEAYDQWDLWDPAISDGTHPYRPSSEGHLVPIESIATVLELCASPFTNPAGAPLVDCDALNGL